MGFMFVMLFPLFGPPGTHLAAAAFGLPFACGFLWDWGLVTGRIRPDSVDRFKPAQRYVLHALPWLLRILAVILALPFIIEHLGTPDRRLLGLSEAAATLLLFLGAAPRSAGILAVCLLGVNQNLAPLVPSQHLLVFIYIGLIFLGGGPASLWPVEEALIFRRIGDPGLAG